jgi:hypothetical protein
MAIFQQVITVPAATLAGPYPVTAKCSDQPDSDLVSTNVYVVTLELSSSSATPGGTISVTGEGYLQCNWVQLRLLRDATQDVTTTNPIVPTGGGFTAEVTVPSSATPGSDYQVDAGCCRSRPTFSTGQPTIELLIDGVKVHTFRFS